MTDCRECEGAGEIFRPAPFGDHHVRYKMGRHEPCHECTGTGRNWLGRLLLLAQVGRHPKGGDGEAGSGA